VLLGPEPPLPEEFFKFGLSSLVLLTGDPIGGRVTEDNDDDDDGADGDDDKGTMRGFAGDAAGVVVAVDERLAGPDPCLMLEATPGADFLPPVRGVGISLGSLWSLLGTVSDVNDTRSLANWTPVTLFIDRDIE
jgi:hypothetical protein